MVSVCPFLDIFKGGILFKGGNKCRYILPEVQETLELIPLCIVKVIDYFESFMKF